MTITEAIAALTRSPGRRFHLDLTVIVKPSGAVQEVEWSYWDNEGERVTESSLDVLVARLTAPADTLADLDAAGVGSIAGT